MEKLLGYIKSRCFIMLIGVLALILLVWFAGPYISFADYKPLKPDWIRLLVIIVLLLGWGVSNVIDVNHSNSKQEKFSDAISASGSTNTTQIETANVKSQFSEALKVLKRSYGKKINRQYLYELPWYLLIGPPGTGKTTALVNSGLDFPLEQHNGKVSLKGVAGTRNCDWWFTNDAVFIDTAGRYITQDSNAQSDRLEWKSFLKLLKKYRKRRPINGVLLTISVDGLISKSAAFKEQQVVAVRARLQELIDDLGINVPVYLLFTKCDLIPGFEDTFVFYNKAQRAQVWGMTLADTQSKQGAALEEWFDEEFQRLIQRLQSHQLSSFHDERDISKRLKILNFPYQLNHIKDNLREFLGNVFSDSRFHDQFLLRGVYLTSGTQDTTSLNRAISQVSLPLRSSVKEMVGKPQQGRSYFLSDLLRKVIIPEAELVGFNHKQEIINHWLRVSTAIACLAVIIGLGFGLSASFAQNQLKLNKVQYGVKEALAKISSIQPDIRPIELIPLFSMESKLLTVFSQFPLWYTDFGLYQGIKINDALLQKSSQLTAGFFKDALIYELEQQLVKPSSTDQLRHALKVYLMFNDAEHHDSDFIGSWFEAHWKNRYFAQPEAIIKLTDRIAVLLEDFEFVEIDMGLVASARDVLRKVPIDQQIFAALEMEANHLFPNTYRFTHKLGSDFYQSFLQNEHEIPKLYTFEGYSRVFRVGLEKAIEELAEDNWVVGTHHGGLTDLDLAEIRSRLEKRYYENYVSCWEQHLYAVTLNQTESLSDTTRLLDNLRSGRSPLRGVLEEVSLNTKLSVSLATEDDVKNNLQDAQIIARKIDPRATKLARIARLAAKNRFANLPESPASLVDKRFVEIHRFVEANSGRPSPIDVLLRDLTELQFFIEKILHSGSQRESSYLLVSKRFSSGKQDILTKLKIQARNYPEPVKNWVIQLTESIWQQILVEARSHISSEFQYRVVPIYKATLEERYPFAPGVTAEVTLNDFNQFFQKDGVIDIFFKDYLEPFVDTTSSPWRLKRVGGRTIGINRHYLNQFELANKIQQMFFADGYEPSVIMSMRPIYLDANISRFELNILGQQQIYRHGPSQALKIEWPSTILDSSISYQFEDYYNLRTGEKFSGPWSLFRFIDKYPLQATKLGNRYQIELKAKGKKAVYEIITASASSPLGGKTLKRFALPTRL